MGKYKLWKLEDLKNGIDRFYQEYGRFPTVSDLDNIDYLPSSRWIQMKFGGMVKVRKDLGYTDSHLGIGKYRSGIAQQINKAGLDFEHEIEKILVYKFGEQFVHVQKRVGNTRERLDFYIYSSSGNFGVDVTNVTGHFRNVQTNTNVKVAKYKNLSLKLLIVVNGDFQQDRIDDWLLNRIKPLPTNWRILTKNNFVSEINKFKPLSINLIPSDRFAQETHRKYHPLAEKPDLV